MDTSGFLFTLLTGVAVIIISYALDHVWAAVMPVRVIYYVIRAPGVVLHESAHIVGCLVTGARIRDVVFFSRDGGSVTYTRPLIPYLGDVIISTAPLFAIPLVLLFITEIFGTYLGCAFPVFPPVINSTGTMIPVAEAIVNTLSMNLITRFNGWFLVYLYLTISLVLSLAPSEQDIKNATAGFLLSALAGVMILWSKIPVAENFLTVVMHLLDLGFTLGLVYGLIALTVSLPLVLWYGYTRRS
jgi:hypothetical protein